MRGVLGFLASHTRPARRCGPLSVSSRSWATAREPGPRGNGQAGASGSGSRVFAGANSGMTSLLAKSVALAGRHVEVEVVVVGLVGIGAQHGAERAAGALVQAAQED